MESTECLLARKLLHVMNKRHVESFTFYMSESERDELIKACANIKNDIGWNFNFQDFYKAFSSYCFPSLEFLWNLHIVQILPLESYLIYTGKEIVQKFKESVIRLCTQDFGESDKQYLIQTGFLTFFVRKAFDATDSVSYDEETRELYLVTVKELLQGIFFMDEKEIGTKRLYCFFSLWNAGILEEITLQNFCSFAIDYYLNFCPVTNDLSAFQILNNTDSSSAPYHLLPVLEKLLKSQFFIGLSPTFASAAQKTQTDIKCLLVATRAFLKTHEEASHFLKRFVLELRNEAYENLNYNLLLKALLIGRQVVFQPNTQLHVCYKHWLQNIFNDCGYLKNNQCFLLLLQVLTDLVPFHENIECLKVAIELNVHVPPAAQSEYSDYIVLLKTRVQDLKPQSKPEETVEKVLSLFEILGKIPPVIMEASLLQKHKYLNEFLPALLRPRVVPQIPDVRERFIEALDKAAKIPSNMLQKYRNECQQEQEQLLISINMINENFDDLLKDSE